MGRVVVGAPSDADDEYAVRALFSLSRGGVTERHAIQMVGTRGSQILETPFRYDGQVQPSRWTAEVQLSWRGETLSYNYQSTPLFPTIYAWRVLVHNEARGGLPLVRVLDGEECSNDAVAWRHHVQEGASSMANLTEPHAVRLAGDHAGQLAEGEPLAAYVATSITSHDERDVILWVWARCRADWYLNGQRVEFLPERQRRTAQSPFHGPTRESAVLRLRAGKNSLVAATKPSESVRASTGLPYWRLGGALTTPAGEVMTDLEFG
jgi:hypothetical protein